MLDFLNHEMFCQNQKLLRLFSQCIFKSHSQLIFSAVPLDLGRKFPLAHGAPDTINGAPDRINAAPDTIDGVPNTINGALNTINGAPNMLNVVKR